MQWALESKLGKCWGAKWTKFSLGHRRVADPRALNLRHLCFKWSPYMVLPDRQSGWSLMVILRGSYLGFGPQLGPMVSPVSWRPLECAVTVREILVVGSLYIPNLCHYSPPSISFVAPRVTEYEHPHSIAPVYPTTITTVTLYLYTVCVYAPSEYQHYQHDTVTIPHLFIWTMCMGTLYCHSAQSMFALSLSVAKYSLPSHF